MPPESDLVKQLSALEVGDIRVSEPLCDHGTWRIGGPADVLVEPHSPEQLSALLKHLSGIPVPVAVIGDGSNLLFDDTGFRGVVVKIAGKMTSLEIDGTTAEDIKQLIQIARNTVFKRTGYWMSYEVKIVLPDGPIKPAHEDIESE